MRKIARLAQFFPLALLAACGLKNAPEPLTSQNNLPAVKSMHYFYEGSQFRFAAKFDPRPKEAARLIFFVGQLPEDCGECSPKRHQIAELEVGAGAEQVGGLIPLQSEEKYIYIEAVIVADGRKSAPFSSLFPAAPTNLATPSLKLVQKNEENWLEWEAPSGGSFELLDGTVSPKNNSHYLLLYFNEPASQQPSRYPAGAGAIRISQPGRYWARFEDNAGNLSELSSPIDVE